MSNFGDQQIPHEPFEQPSYSSGPSSHRPKGSNTWVVVLLAVFGLIGVLGLVCCGGAYYVAQQVRTEISKFGVEVWRQALIAKVSASNLSKKDQREVIGQIDRVTDAVRDGRLNNDDATEFAREFGESPLFLLANLKEVKQNHLESSTLLEDEKQQGQLTIDRVTRGVISESIDGDEVLDVVANYWMELFGASKAADVNDERTEPTLVLGVPPFLMELKRELTDEELRQCLTELKQLADSASIPEEPYEADLRAGFKRIADRYLKDISH